MLKTIGTLLFGILAISESIWAQTNSETQLTPKPNIVAHINYQVDMQGAVSKGKTPLWLHSNKYGLGSLQPTNGYMRASMIRPLATDTFYNWGIGYGADVVLPYHYTSKVVVQQAFVEARWLHGALSVGSKEYAMQLKNNALSSGAQTLGINARPIPQIRLWLPNYYTLPFANGWLHLKGHVAYGKTTDDNWQHTFTQQQHKYADDVLYHSKAGYLKIGNQERFCPLSVELGLEMATLFGGTSYQPLGNGKTNVIKGNTGPKAFWYAFIPGGHDAPEEGTAYQNVEGDQLGSWLARINYDADEWKISLYGEKFFEDHSSMFQLDYDGYGTGKEWNVKKEQKYFLYDLKDMLLGIELQLKYNQLIQNIVVEYLYSKYQSGPIYHDHTQNLSHHISGRDNYYNHYIYTGWQHWGEVIGNPLYRSPLYNDNQRIEIQNNRVKAFHVGISGNPVDKLYYRLLGTYQEGYGTYNNPFTKKQHNVSVMAEAAYSLPHGWQIKGACGADFGGILGYNQGVQLTVSKRGLLNFF